MFIFWPVKKWRFNRNGIKNLFTEQVKRFFLKILFLYKDVFRLHADRTSVIVGQVFKRYIAVIDVSANRTNPFFRFGCRTAGAGSMAETLDHGKSPLGRVDALFAGAGGTAHRP